MAATPGQVSRAADATRHIAGRFVLNAFIAPRAGAGHYTAPKTSKHEEECRHELLAKVGPAARAKTPATTTLAQGVGQQRARRDVRAGARVRGDFVDEPRQR